MSAQIAAMIIQAIGKGFKASTILNLISKKFPQIAGTIANANALGYTADKILKHLSDPVGKNPGNADEFLTESEKADKSIRQQKKKVALGVGAVGAAGLAAAAGLGGLGSLGLSAASAIDPTDPQSPAPSMPQDPPAQLPGPTPTQPIQPGPNIGQQLGQQVQQPIENAMQPAAPNQVAQAAQAIQQPQQPPASIFSQLMGGVDPNTLDPEKQKQLQFLSMISDQLQSKGKGLADPEFQKLAEKVKGIVKGKPGMAIQEGTRFKEAYPETPGQIVPEKAVPEQVKEVKQPIAKGSSVITPSGDIATIEDLPGKTARVDVDGKQQVHNTDDLIPVPDNSDEIGDLYQKLIDKIPEGHKSRVYDAIGYDPVRNAIKYTYHDGKSYIIDDVPEEIAKEIANSGFLAKTTGGNYMGFYYQGNPSIGAGMHVLISDLQKLRGGKGKEYSYKFEELYSQHRLPKQILKERFDKEKLREREEKKKAKKK